MSSSICIIVADVNVKTWQHHEGTCANGITFDDYMKIIVLFVNAYMITNRYSELSIIINHGSGTETIFPYASSDGTNDSMTCSSRENEFKPIMHKLSAAILDKLSQYNRQIKESSSQSDALPSTEMDNSSLFQALSKSLCLINKKQKKFPMMKSRMVVFQLSNDDFSKYDAVMDTIFSANKLNVVIDAMILSRNDSSFLQQACFITRGVYMHPLDHKDIYQTLLTDSLPNADLREMALEVSIQTTVKFKSSCFCHNNIVEFAYMCSLCLSLTCECNDVCITCGVDRSKKTKQAATTTATTG